MPSIDLDALTLPELIRLNRRLTKAIDEHDNRKKGEALEALQAHAKQMGFSLDALIGVRPARKRDTRPKYRHPENALITWSGLGRKPAWVNAAVEAGHSLEALALR